MLDPLEGLLDSPAAVIERPELRGRIARRVEQVGHQRADVAAWGDVADQPHRSWNGLDFVDRRLGSALGAVRITTCSDAPERRKSATQRQPQASARRQNPRPRCTKYATIVLPT